MSARTSRTLGAFNVPAALPIAEFDFVNERVAKRSSGNDDIWYGFATAWKAVACRMRAALDHESAFAVSVAASTAPPPEQRYRQDHDLFGFMVSAVSAIECFYFAAYRIEALLKPTAFPPSKPSSLKFDAGEVTRRFGVTFPGESLTGTMRAILEGAEYKQVTALRNFLAHRGTPTRFHSFGTSGQDIPSAIPGNLADLASNWRYDLQLSPRCLDPYRVWLEDSIHELIKAAADFVSSRL
jgi:hypothetical protein